jgi:hypothetical protein
MEALKDEAEPIFILKEIKMYRVWIPQLNCFIFNIPPDEALVYLEEGYKVIRMKS